MALPAVIDLGEDRSAPDPAGVPRSRRSRWPLALGLVLALLLGGAAAPRPGLVALFRVPYAIGAAFVAGRDTLYVAANGTVSGYRLPGGAPRGSAAGAGLWRRRAPATLLRWTVPAPGVVEGMLLAPGAGVLMVSRAEPPTSTIGLDAGTGQLLWRVDSALVATVLPGERQAVLFTPGPGASSLIRAVDTRTGRTAWLRAQPGTVAPTGPWTDLRAQPPRLVFHTAAGGIEVVAATTGDVLARGRLPEGTDGVQLSTAGNQLLLTRRGARTLAALDLATLDRRWQVTVPAASYFATSCGTVLCVFAPRSLTGVDPGTGALLWQTRRWQDAQPLPRGRLLVTSAEPDRVAAIVDAATLRPVLDLGRWQALAGERTLLLTRAGTGAAAWFAVVDVTAPRPAARTLGTVPGVRRDECLASDGYLACPTVHNALQVWSYRD